MPGGGPNVDQLAVPLAAPQLVFRGLSNAASFLSPQFATVGHPRRIAGRSLHLPTGYCSLGLQLRIIRSAMGSFAIHP